MKSDENLRISALQLMDSLNSDAAVFLHSHWSTTAGVKSGYWWIGAGTEAGTVLTNRPIGKHGDGPGLVAPQTT